MANILLVDPDKVAQRAMEGMLARGKHRLACVETADEAHDFIRQNLSIDLILTELKLKDENGLSLIQKLKLDPILKRVPIVVYTAHADRASVKAVLELQVQNFLLKPYRDEALFLELAKANAKDWRSRFFAQEEVIRQKSGISAEDLQSAIAELRADLGKAVEPLLALAAKQAPKPLTLALRNLAVQAAKCGAVGVIAILKGLHERVQEGDWNGFGEQMELLELLDQVIALRLEPDLVTDGFRSPEEQHREEEDRARAWWAAAPQEDRCPVLPQTQLARQIDALPGWPVVDSIAASFQMAANGHPTSLAPLLDLVQNDPSLTAEILAASNRIKKKDDADNATADIEEPRMAVGLLGELRLATIASSLDTIEERMLTAAPQANWPSFRMFQLGTARLARFVCCYLEMPGLETPAYTAGLLHDIGKLLLTRLHPFAFPAIYSYAMRSGVKLATAERLFLDGMSTQEMALRFAEKQGLPRRFINVLRWINDPEQAIDDAELVAVVSLARDLCRHNHVGFCGDTPRDEAGPLEASPEWQVLRSRVFLNFDLKKFERRAHAECLQVKRELLAQLPKRAVA